MSCKHIFRSILLIVISGVLLFSCNEEKSKTNNGELSEAASGDSIESIEQISEQIRKNPENAPLFQKRAKLWIFQGNIAEAQNDISIALKLDSLKPEYYFDQAEFFIMKGESGKAKNSIEKCLSFFPDNTEALVKLSEIYMYVKNYKESLTILKKVEELDPNIAYTYFIKGIIYKETGDTVNAIDNLLITVNKEPEFYNAYVLLGMLSSDLGDTLAIDFYKTAIRIIPNSIEAHYNLGLFYQQNSRYLAAIDMYKKIINEIDSTYFPAYYNIAYIQLQHFKEYREALDYFNKALSLNPEYVETIYNIGLCYELLKDYDKARSFYNKALEKETNYDLAIQGLNRLDD
ncbi:MAG: hypothetical protein C0594_03590 [Marinilabiliales bacterium]|nr:MAG: hypothetical protein C0594_03590 [Marinilabiliales bacterium]